jgi:hypothetical protein
VTHAISEDFQLPATRDIHQAAGQIPDPSPLLRV